MIAKFFGESARQLYGVYHRPEGRARDVGVVLCNPAPQEYRHAHWAYRKLAGMLAAEGFHAFRFDYFATGDSAGDSDAGTLDQWTTDIGSAANELRDIASLSRVSLVGIRIGAALATRASANGLAVEDLVLWEPVVSGKAYLTELETAQSTYLSRVRPPEDNTRTPGELLGYPMPPAVRESVGDIDLLRDASVAPRRVLIVTGEERIAYQQLMERYRELGVAGSRQVVPEFMLYPGGIPAFIWVAHAIPATITAWLARKTV